MNRFEKHKSIFLNFLSDYIGVNKNTNLPDTCNLIDCENCTFFRSCDENHKQQNVLEWLNRNIYNEKVYKEIIDILTVLIATEPNKDKTKNLLTNCRRADCESCIFNKKLYSCEVIKQEWLTGKNFKSPDN